MLKKLYAIILLLTVSATAFAQTGSINGVITDAKTKEGIPFANVVAFVGGTQRGGGSTDINGRYKISNLPPGTYDLKVTYVGYQSAQVNGIRVSSDKVTAQNFALEVAGYDGKEVVIFEYAIPLISKDPPTDKIVDRAAIAALPTRDVNSIAATAAGVFQADEGGSLSMRGSRADGTEYFVDGMRTRGTPNIPSQAIEQTSVITGGIPASYGDATGGIVSITTRGPSGQFFGGAEILTSAGILEPYGYNLASFNLSGPLYKINKGQKNERSILGFFMTLEAETQKDANPSAGGNWQLNPDRLAQIQANPLRPSPTGVGFIQEGEFVRLNEMELVDVRPNAQRNRVSFAGKLDFAPNQNFGITLGGTYDRTWGSVFSRQNSVFNSQNFRYSENETWRTFARIRQSFADPVEGDEQTASNFRNSAYSIQVDYGRTNFKEEDANLGRNAFAYGYNGKFDVNLQPFYTTADDTLRIPNLNGDTIVYTAPYQVLEGFAFTDLQYTAGTYDNILSNYNTQIFDILDGQPINNLDQLQLIGGLVNGLQPRNIYGIWRAPGFQPGGYSFGQNNIFRLTGNFQTDFKGHTIKFGVEFDQRTDRGYNLNPFATNTGLWGLARGLANGHISELDLANPNFVVDEFGFFLDTVNYNRLYNGQVQGTFDRNLRQSLGLPVDGTDFIFIDRLDPSEIKVDFFSANELLNNGNSLVNYFGYDHLGNRLTSKPGALDFFNDPINRPIDAFRPSYLAFYLEDRFEFDDLVFRLGVRVDRFDANQPVLRDPYNLYDSYTVGDVKNGTTRPGVNVLNANTIPEFLNNDVVVYVNDANSSTPSILGYRDGDRWFGSNGEELRIPTPIAQNSADGRVTPFLKNPGQETVDGSAFRDYAPQWNVMPRVAFSFPISDEAQFFAHYDVLTQRPSQSLRFNPISIFFLENTGGTIANSALRPETTIDYQLGFKQKLNKVSALTIQAFYRELRDMIQIIPINFAYPINYNTFGNIDFGTVKGLTLSYDLRRIGNVRMDASYTLQFADGTGSDPNFATNIIQAGLDGLRTPLPLNFDARHRFVANFDFRYGSGKSYNGPKYKDRNLLENFGFNLVANAISGTPFSRQTFVTPDAAFGISGRTNLKGSINGSRLPWQFRVNLRVDKDFQIQHKLKEGETKAKTSSFNVYIQVLNLLDARNVLGVYRFTGDPQDDGYLSSDLGTQQANNSINPASFLDLYTTSMQNPANFSLPRRTRLGIQFNF